MKQKALIYLFVDVGRFVRPCKFYVLVSLLLSFISILPSFAVFFTIGAELQDFEQFFKIFMFSVILTLVGYGEVMI